MIVGFGYKAGVGKDTSGDYLASKYGFTKDRFARSLKDMCMELFSLSSADVDTEEGKSREFDTPVTYTKHLDAVVFSRVFSDLRGCGIDPSHLEVPSSESWLGRKLRTPREVLQFVGTDVIRNYFPDYHLEMLLARASSSAHVAVCDVRFPNEAYALKSAGGVLVNVVRPVTAVGGGVSAHKSETALDGFKWDYVVENTGSFEDLYKQLDSVMTLSLFAI